MFSKPIMSLSQSLRWEIWEGLEDGVEEPQLYPVRLCHTHENMPRPVRPGEEHWWPPGNPLNSPAPELQV